MAEERGSIILNFTAHVKSIKSDCLSQTVTTPGRYSTSTSPKNYRFTCELEEGYKISGIDFVDGTGGNNSLSGFTDNTFTISISAPSGMLCSASIYVSEVQKAQKFISLDNLARFKAKCDETYAKTGEGGGITKSTVIEYTNSLPTATADSPDFVQTPDGVLYRKKAVEGGSLLGTWVFNDTINSENTFSFSFSFTCNDILYKGIQLDKGFQGEEMYYIDTSDDMTLVYSVRGTWEGTAYKTIQITDISALTNEEEFTSWLTANATKQGGGASVTYSYVALADA